MVGPSKTGSSSCFDWGADPSVELDASAPFGLELDGCCSLGGDVFCGGAGLGLITSDGAAGRSFTFCAASTAAPTITGAAKRKRGDRQDQCIHPNYSWIKRSGIMRATG